jgi:cell division protein FtsQ
MGGRIAAAAALLLCLGICYVAVLLARNVLLHDERFFIPSSSSIELQGNTHVTRAQLMGVFGEDVERNIFSIDMAQRRVELERLPWVAHATVMRLLPNRIRVSIVERTPVAFVRQGSHVGLVDAAGVLLDMPPGAKMDASYSFPVVSGIVASDPVSTRAARMKIFERFTADLDGSGQKISEELSEVDLSNPEDVKALIPDHSNEILVHFGDTDFLDRYHRFEQHLPEWRTTYPKLSSVDMRYERQVVLEMQSGSAVPVAGEGDAGPATASTAEPVGAETKAAAKTSPATHVAGAAARKAAKRPSTRSHGAVAKHSVAAKSRAAKTTVHAKLGATTKTQTPTAKHPPAVVGNSSSAPTYYPSQVVHP